MKYVFILFGCIVCFNSYVQQYDKNWLVGGGGTKSTHIIFDNPLLIDSVSRSMEIDRAAISVSDSLGNLIFYSNGIKIHNAQHQLMQNGDSLNPG
ncbi:hypothetical protein [Aureispira sp. CCB-E]|uniref:hypothetical protein n=1 Tax=Aureispira sp. CCB-E TaxID=3051121 RepID=UPI002868F2C6|nr:hypothetical protein [Aureispira sp. CCB-E]WMX13752.1 hypothetical protein QP953_23150 [Aureispira sp. CCB-E]